MSQPFSFPPPPPPPPRREALPQDTRGGFRGRGNHREYHPGGSNPALRGRGSYGNHNRSRGRGRGHPARGSFTSPPKRDFSTAFADSPHNTSKAPPPIPASDFDVHNVLLDRQRVSTSETTAKRKSNLLGLTPVNDDVSASDDNDEDEEARLAAAPRGEGLQFEHKGRQMSLKTPAEIAAWITERKKRYPTQAKVEAARQEEQKRKAEWEAQRRARDEASRLKRELRDKERIERQRQKLKEKAIAAQIARVTSAATDHQADASSEAQSRAEKLRRKVEKAAKDLQTAEEKLRDLEQEENGKVEEDAENTDASNNSEGDETSSSGSSQSDSDPDINAAPEELTSKRTKLDRVAPSKQSLVKAGDGEPPLCRNLVKFGRCKFGKKCRFSHKLQQDKAKHQPGVSARRKGLYQIMVEKEEEDTMKRALRVIIALGEQGKLNDPPPQPNLVNPSNTAN